MPMYYKYTMIIQATTVPIGGAASQRTGGWTESVYWDSIGPQSRASFLRLCQRRAALLPNAFAVVGQRYQQVEPVGGSSTGATRFPGLQVSLTESEPTADIPQMCLLCRTRTAGPNIRPTMIRGLPDFVVKGGEYTPAPLFTGPLNAYFEELAGWLMRGRDLTATTYPIYRISNDGIVSFTAVTAISTPTMVRILRTLNSNGDQVGGVFKATSQPTTSSLQLEGWTGGATEGGKVRANAVIFPVLTTTDISRVITRRIGRAPFQYVGRRSRQR